MKRRILIALLLVGTILFPAPTPTTAAHVYSVAYFKVITGGGKTGGVIGKSACFTSTRRIEGTSIGGFRLFAYGQTVNWCSSAGKITGTVSRTRTVNIYSTFWEFRGHVDSAHSGSTAWQTWFTQGAFALCGPTLACVQFSYPYISQTVYPSGFTHGYNGS